MTAEDARGLEAVRALAPVSRETGERLARYVALLRHWQRTQNLVAAGTLDEVWARHIADSAQLLVLAPGARRILDLGSGAGFPGLVLAILISDRPQGEVHLVESNGKKAAFLRAAARETGAPAKVHAVRIDVFARNRGADAEPFDLVTARALAPLPRLLELMAPFLGSSTTALVHKGQDFAAEVEEASKYWAFDMVKHSSRTESRAVVLAIRNLARRHGLEEPVR